jgi:hypothetical protein
MHLVCNRQSSNSNWQHLNELRCKIIPYSKQQTTAFEFMHILVQKIQKSNRQHLNNGNKQAIHTMSSFYTGCVSVH